MSNRNLIEGHNNPHSVVNIENRLRIILRYVNGWGSARDSRLPLYALGYTNHRRGDTSLLYSRGRFSLSSQPSEKRDGEKKVANQLFADGATTPGRGCNVPGLLIPRWKLCPVPSLYPMRERETISRAREPWLRWLFSDSVGFRAHDLMYACTDSSCCGSTIMPCPALKSSHAITIATRRGGGRGRRKEDVDDDENEDDGIRGAA